MHRLLPHLQRQFLASARMVQKNSLQRLALMWAMALALLAGHVQGFAAVTVNTSFVTGGVNSPIGMAVDAANNLYVASWGDNKIVKFAASGGTIAGGSSGTALDTTGFNSVTALVVDSAGNLYAGNANGVIRKYPAAAGIPGATGTDFLTGGALSVPFCWTAAATCTPLTTVWAKFTRFLLVCPLG